MSYLAVNEAKKNLNRLIDEVAENHEPTLIKGKDNTAVLVSIDDWKGLKETMYLYSIPGLVESIKESINSPEEEWIKEKDLPDDLAWLRDRKKNV